MALSTHYAALLNLRTVVFPKHSSGSAKKHTVSYTASSSEKSTTQKLLRMCLRIGRGTSRLQYIRSLFTSNSRPRNTLTYAKNVTLPTAISYPIGRGRREPHRTAVAIDATKRQRRKKDTTSENAVRMTEKGVMCTVRKYNNPRVISLHILAVHHLAM